MAHLAVNLSHIIVPVLGLVVVWHVLHGHPTEALLTVVVGAVAVVLLGHPGEASHLVAGIGNVITSTASQLVH